MFCENECLGLGTAVAGGVSTVNLKTNVRIAGDGGVFQLSINMRTNVRTAGGGGVFQLSM